MSRVFSLEFKVRDYELDQFHVINNAVYLNYLEHTRHEFLNEIGINPAEVALSGRSLALSEIHVQYKGSLRSREHFRVEADLQSIKGARISINQRIFSQPKGDLILKALVVAVFLDENGRPMRISAENKAAFQPYLIDR